MNIGALGFHKYRISWHWDWSLTWRWIASIRKWDGKTQLGLHRIKTHQGKAVICVFNTPLFCLSLQTQPNMIIT